MRFLRALSIVAFFTIIAHTAEPLNQAQLQPGSKLWLVGDSTLHAFASTTSDIKLSLALKNPALALFDEIRKGEMTSLDVSIPVISLKSEKTQLDRNMYKALKSEQAPSITFHLVSYEVTTTSSPSSFVINAKGDLSVAGQTKPIDLSATVTHAESNEATGPVQIKGSEELLMTDYGVKPPSFMGAIRTHDRVVINFDLLLTKLTK